MKLQKKKMLSSATMFLLIFSNTVLPAQDMGLILPMPGKSSNPPKTQPKNNVKPQINQDQNSKTLIQLPSKIHSPQKKETNNSKPTAATIINLKKPAPVKAPQTSSSDDSNELKIPDEITIEPLSNSGQDLLISGNDTSALQPENTGNGSSGDLPIFPKDTSSAIFMVMKTWQCDNYDVGTLLSHSVKVYGEESVDQFEIKGLNSESSTKISVDEEDITLDELLDLVANKTDRDWGVDIPSKVIYFYPKGTKTTTVDTW